MFHWKSRIKPYKAEFKPYEADSELDVILYSDEITEGMQVLIADPMLQEGILENFVAASQWCTVTKLRRDTYFLRFVGLYQCGTLRFRKVATNHAWVVRRITVPTLT